MNDVLKKLRFSDDTAVVFNAPPDLKIQFASLGFPSSFGKTPAEKSLVFVNSPEELNSFLTLGTQRISYDGLLWIAYKKGNIKITQLHRDIVSKTAETYGYASVTLISLNEEWSAMRLRPIEKVGKKK